MNDAQPLPEQPTLPPIVTETGSKITKTIAGTVMSQAGNLVASPTATEEDQLISLGQRNVNLIWEHTQMKIALSVVFGVMSALMFVVLVSLWILAANWSKLNDVTIAVLIAVLTGALSSLTSMGSLVIGFYFGRTNHQKIGGVDQGR